MAGHSKWSKIKHQKAINDAKKGKTFSKLAQQISICARDGGGDLDVNFSLRLLVDKAKAVSMPSENVKRAIDRGTGKSGEALNLEHVMYEGFGPEGVAIIVETLTDNRNRTVSEIRQIFNENNGSLGDFGSVSWNFEQKGFIEMKAGKMVKSEKFGEPDKFVPIDSEEVLLQLMEIEGVLDIQTVEDQDSGDSALEVYTDSKMLGAVRDQISSLGLLILSAELIWEPKMYKEGNEEKLQGFIDQLEELEEVQNIYSDLK